MLRRILSRAAAMARLQRIPRAQYVIINDAKMNIPTIPEIPFDFTESWMTDLLSRVLKVKDGAFFDVGVNVGQTLVKIKALEPEREYVGFEPNPACVFFVERLIRQNRMRLCTILPVGLFTESRVLALDLYLDSQSDASASIIPHFRQDKAPVSRMLVPVFEFDRVAPFADRGAVGVVKIDVEGAELEVLRTLGNVINRDHPILLFEVLPVYTETNAFRLERQRHLEKELSSSGYQLFRVLKSEANEYAGAERIETIGVHGDMNQCDYVAASGSDIGELETVLDSHT